MHCHHLLYKPLTSINPYERYISKEREREITLKKELFYSEILKFTSSRYPKEFLLELEKEINPFEYSLETLRTIILNRYPDLPEDVVNESVEYVFGKKARESHMIKESEFVIEDGSEYIRNGRKLIKEDFSFMFDKGTETDSFLPSRNTDRLSHSRSDAGSISKRSNRTSILENYKNSQSPSQTDRGLLSSPRRNTSSMMRNELFNKFIAEEIDRENGPYKNIDIILENSADDIIVKELNAQKQGFTDRSRKSHLETSFPNFKERDIVIAQEGNETNRTDLEELNHLLSEISLICEEKEGMTDRSDRGMYTMKISKKNMENLYNIRGSIKMDTIKRAASRIIAEYSESFGGKTER